MRIAIPVENGNLTPHFGHCSQFVLFDVKDKKILEEKVVNPPEHKPGVYPKFLNNQKVDVIIAGNMGQRAKSIFEKNEIEVVLGVNYGDPRKIVSDYLVGELELGNNLCDH